MRKQGDDPVSVDAASIAGALGSQLAFGLNSLQAAERLAREGTNELRVVASISS